MSNQQNFKDMKVVELLKIGGEMLKVMSAHEVYRDDWRYVALYETFLNMRANGMKYRAAIAVLSEEYQVSRATVERVIRRLGADC